MIDSIAPGLIAAGVAFVAAFLVFRKKDDDRSRNERPVDLTGPELWVIDWSSGVPPNPLPHPEGFAIEIPQQGAGSLHYVTAPTGSLTGKTKVTLHCRVEAEPGVKLVPRKFPGAPSLLTLYFQRRDDNWSARGEFEAYRWYAAFATKQNLRAGEYVLEARFDQNWTAVMGSSRENNPNGFREALEHARRIGFVLGGGDGLGHGVYATGPARLVVTSFKVE